MTTPTESPRVAVVTVGDRGISDAGPAHLRAVFDANVLGCLYCAGEAARGALLDVSGGR